jgi:hypothetical protein
VASQVNSIEMSLGNGNDSALIGSVGESLNLFGDLVIKDNHGDDHYELYDNVHANRINIETGAGSDTVLVYFSSANSIVVDAGADDDNVDFLLDSARSLNIVAGQGDDAVSIRNLTVNSLMVDTGSGDDEMVMSADTISTAMLIKLGDGLDSIRASSITGPGNGVVDGGIDTDIYDRTFGGNSGYSIIAFESVVF